MPMIAYVAIIWNEHTRHRRNRNADRRDDRRGERLASAALRVPTSPHDRHAARSRETRARVRARARRIAGVRYAPSAARRILSWRTPRVHRAVTRAGDALPGARLDGAATHPPGNDYQLRSPRRLDRAA